MGRGPVTATSARMVVGMIVTMTMIATINGMGAVIMATAVTTTDTKPT